MTKQQERAEPSTGQAEAARPPDPNEMGAERGDALRATEHEIILQNHGRCAIDLAQRNEKRRVAPPELLPALGSSRVRETRRRTRRKRQKQNTPAATATGSRAWVGSGRDGRAVPRPSGAVQPHMNNGARGCRPSILCLRLGAVCVAAVLERKSPAAQRKSSIRSAGGTVVPERQANLLDLVPPHPTKQLSATSYLHNILG